MMMSGMTKPKQTGSFLTSSWANLTNSRLPARGQMALPSSLATCPLTQLGGDT
ncbi:hypothetical protein BC936DRAFT_137963 [Jimgerdemannia flammicorona]|uniref:Uncharacterized protein n=1 Tax=Jimgerdemannia flammicorona TaxID=994334 RepID=A0A433CW62_9FUNG|nr:hypothetical protein BC936DRAFT_137963 [Jimgerdemannia flammicorona]